MASVKHLVVRTLLPFWTVCLLLCLHAFASDAQIRIIPKEKIDSMANPVLSEDAASFEFVRDSIDAGMIAEGDSVRTCCYMFRNIGKKPVVITRVATTCSCLKARCENRVIRPMETSRIFADYYPEGHFGRFEKRIFVYTAASEKSPSAVLKLSVAVGLEADDKSHDSRAME